MVSSRHQQAHALQWAPLDSCRTPAQWDLRKSLLGNGPKPVVNVGGVAPGGGGVYEERKSRGDFPPFREAARAHSWTGNGEPLPDPLIWQLVSCPGISLTRCQATGAKFSKLHSCPARRMGAARQKSLTWVVLYGGGSAAPVLELLADWMLLLCSGSRGESHVDGFAPPFTSHV